MRDWEKHYQDGEVPWDKGRGAPPLAEWMVAHPGELTGEILVPGCGLGHDVRLLAENTSGAITGFDLSPTAVEQARAIPAVGSEEYVAGDLFDPPHDWVGRFDWIWEHTCFCAIDPSQRERYVTSVKSLLKPGGSLLAVFYLNPYDDEHGPDEGPPHGCTEDELRERFVEKGGFLWEEGYVPGDAYPSRVGQELLVRLTRC